jgi:hypothetical protein
MSIRSLAPLAIILWGALTASAHAQSIEGLVLDAETEAPLPGVLVSLLDEAGDRVRAVLSDEAGHFRIEVHRFGRYRLRAERIGLTTTTSDAFMVFSTDPVERQLRLDARAVEIAGLVVDSRVTQCRLDGERAIQIQRWWQDVRTALDVSSVISGQGIAQFNVERFEREWDEGLERIVRSQGRQETSVSERPFVSADAAFLSNGGFVQGDLLAGQREYFAPDADVLLSDVFLGDHCFSIREHQDDRWVGLSFEPNRISDIPDIEGTLWIDTVSAELQSLDFRYASMEGVPDSESGGYVEFEYLPSGAWIVREWYIRMPRLGLRPGGRDHKFELLGYVDVGGTVELREAVSTDRDRLSEVGALRGTVYDSIRGQGLADATVAIIGTRLQALTDIRGEFVLRNVPVGSHRVTFVHDDPMAWGLGSPFRTVDVEAERTSSVYLSLPSFRQTARVVCTGSGAEAETVLLGHIVDEEGLGLQNVRVVLEWLEIRHEEHEFDRAHEVRTGADGRFVVCTVPADAPVSVSVHLEEIAGQGLAKTRPAFEFEVIAPAGDIVYRRMMIPGVH